MTAPGSAGAWQPQPTGAGVSPRRRNGLSRAIIRADMLFDQQFHSSGSLLQRNLTGAAVAAGVTCPWLAHSPASARQPGQFTWHASEHSGSQTSRQNHVMLTIYVLPKTRRKR